MRVVLVKKFLLVPVQYLLPQHLLSKIWGLLTCCRFCLIKNSLIKLFIKIYHIDLSEYERKEVSLYTSFQDFFTRQLDFTKRSIQKDEMSILSPTDSMVIQIGHIHQNQLIQAKNKWYSVEILLGGSVRWVNKFDDGDFATLYLSPQNYHRVHMPLTGKLVEKKYVSGSLFAVNPSTTSMVRNLFNRNERMVCIFETNFGLMAIVMVGALFVSGIKMTEKLKIGMQLNQIEELGYFAAGSTVILLFQKHQISWNSGLNIVQMGQKIGTKLV